MVWLRSCFVTQSVVESLTENWNRMQTLVVTQNDAGYSLPTTDKHCRSRVAVSVYWHRSVSTSCHILSKHLKTPTASPLDTPHNGPSMQGCRRNFSTPTCGGRLNSPFEVTMNTSEHSAATGGSGSKQQVCFNTRWCQNFCLAGRPQTWPHFQFNCFLGKTKWILSWAVVLPSVRQLHVI